MRAKKFIKPISENLIVRDPITKNILPPTGDYKPFNSYWRRRINDGSVVVVKKIKEEKKVEEIPENKMEKQKYSNKSINKGD